MHDDSSSSGGSTHTHTFSMTDKDFQLEYMWFSAILKIALRTDRRTDTASGVDARTHLKMWRPKRTCNDGASLVTLHLRSSQPIVHWAPHMHSTSPPSWNATPEVDIVGSNGVGVTVAGTTTTVATAATAAANTKNDSNNNKNNRNSN